MSYFLATAITLNRFSKFPLIRYFSSEIIHLGNAKRWWRPGTEDFANNDIRSYKITFSEELVNDLKYKLRNSKILKRSMLNTTTFNESSKMLILSKLLHHWTYNYDFKEREKYINSYSHFMTNIQGLDIHFVHVNYVEKYNVKKKIKITPMLLLHGWPSSVIEFYKEVSLNKLVKEREIIIPSLPGFGFSSAPTISSFTCIEMSVVLRNLMLRLGHDEFIVKDGAYGAINGRIMSMLFPQQCRLINDLNAYKYNSIYSKEDYCFPELIKKIASIEKVLKELGYFPNQTSEMNTDATDLNNSPTALAAYFINENLNISPVSSVKDLKIYKQNFFTDMIDNLMMYWAPKCINTAMQVYTGQCKTLPNIIDLIKNL